MTRLQRLRRQAIASLERRLAFFRLDAHKASVREVLDGVCDLGAAYWDLYRDDAGINAPGEVVCRHVAAAADAVLAGIQAHLDTKGVESRVYTWKTEPVPGSPYGGHATLHVKAGARWYYVEWKLNLDGTLHQGVAQPVRNGAAEKSAASARFAGLPMRRDGAPDAGWMRNRSFGRSIIEFIGRSSPDTLRTWRREFLRQRLYNLAELRSGQAEELVGHGRGRRKVLA